MSTREAPQGRNAPMFETKLAMGMVNSCLYMWILIAFSNNIRWEICCYVTYIPGARGTNLRSSESDVSGYMDRYAGD